MTPRTSHDQNFKNLVVDYPRQALDLFVPDEAALLGSDVRLLAIRQEQQKERLAESFRELDAPLLAEWPEGEPPRLYLIEIESHAGRFSALRMARYVLDAVGTFGVSWVVPIVVVLQGRVGPDALKIRDARGPCLEFRTRICALAKLSACDWEQSSNLVARLNLVNMSHPREARVRLFASSLEALVRFEPDLRKRLKWVKFVDLYARLEGHEMIELKQLLIAKGGRQMEEGIQFVDYLRREGRVEGLAEGRVEGLAEGRVEGLAAGLLRVVESRGFLVDDALRQRVGNATEEELLAWLSRAATADTLGAIFGE